MATANEVGFVPTSEAAFIAGISDSDMNRMVDEDIVPRELVRLDEGRRFSRLSAAFASFYLKTDETLVAGWRKRVLQEITRRVVARPDRDTFLLLETLPGDFDWVVADDGRVQVNISEFVYSAAARVRQVEQARSLVSVDAGVMSGMPVFTGTRVPIETVLGSLDGGMSLEELREGWPFLTPACIEAARVFTRVNPRRGRPRRMNEVDPRLRVVERGAPRHPGAA